jgi:SAM-dependent methyltransferase
MTQLAGIDDVAALAGWRRALAPPGRNEPPLVSLLEDWGEFSGLDWPTMLRRVHSSHEEVAEEFEKLRPSAAQAVAELYNETETLIPLLLWWHGTDLNPARCATGAARVMSAAGVGRVLDFGCGIGSTALVLAEGGHEVVLADVAEGPLRFADWRMRRRGHEAGVVRLLDTPLEDAAEASYQGVTAFDVFEHLTEIRPSLEQIDRVLAPGGVICFNQVYVPAGEGPHHYPQRGEALVWLHQHDYRLAHATHICWVAQKDGQRAGERLAQSAAIRARIASTRLAEGLRGPGSGTAAHRIISHALR